MQARPVTADIWFTEGFGRGYGALLGRITPMGARQFYFRYLGSACQVRLSIGAYDPKGDGERTFSVAQARIRATEWAKLYHGDGQRPGIKDLREHFAALEAQRKHALESEAAATAEAARHAEFERARRLTVRQLFERWAAVELAPRPRADGTRQGRKDGGQYTREQFERRLFPKLGDVPVADVKKADLIAVLDEAKAQGKLRTANVLLTEMKQMLRFALVRELVERNVLDLVTKKDAGGKETERDRRLSIEEISLLAQALASADLAPRSGAALWIILTTLCRPGELMGATWADAREDEARLRAAANARGVQFGVVDLDARTWYLPETKNQRDHTIHLSDFALKQFSRLRELREAGRDGAPLPWLFPNRDGTGPLSENTFAKQLADRQRAAAHRLQGRTRNTGVLVLPGGNWRAHDLRRTGASLMSSIGISGDVIDECQNHMQESRVRRIYIRDRREAEQRRAFDALGAHLSEILDGKTNTNVVRLRA